MKILLIILLLPVTVLADDFINYSTDRFNHQLDMWDDPEYTRNPQRYERELERMDRRYEYEQEQQLRWNQQKELPIRRNKNKRKK